MRVVGVDVTPEDDDGHSTRAGQLERDRGRLGAAAGHPRVVDDQDVRARDRPVDAQPAGVNAPRVRRLLRHHGQPGKRKIDARPDDSRQRMTARPSPAARHHANDRRRGRHPRRAPDRLPVVHQVGGQHRPQPRRRFGRVGPVRLIPPQVNRERTAPDRVSDRSHHVREQLPGLPPGEITLVTPGNPDLGRPPASPAEHPQMLRIVTDKTRPAETGQSNVKLAKLPGTRTRQDQALTLNSCLTRYPGRVFLIPSQGISDTPAGYFFTQTGVVSP
jgi:hypothetical protein